MLFIDMQYAKWPLYGLTLKSGLYESVLRGERLIENVKRERSRAGKMLSVYVYVTLYMHTPNCSHRQQDFKPLHYINMEDSSFQIRPSPLPCVFMQRSTLEATAKI